QQMIQAAKAAAAAGRGSEADELLARAAQAVPGHPAVLNEQGLRMMQRGEAAKARELFQRATSADPNHPALWTNLASSLHALRLDDAALAGTIEERLAAIRAQRGGGPYRRVEKCIELLTGKRSRYVPQPTFLYFPDLPTPEYFDGVEFPWLGAIEAATDEIRGELTTVLSSDQAGLQPYVSYPEGVPLDQWRELNKSRRWSAYFLWNEGVAQPEHLARCPRTAQVLQSAPQCNVAEHGPNAFFSILEARTHIPPHTGVTNARLTVHLPLIVPPECGFRVGSETREWIPGKAWVFDDTIEHEAWNGSDTPRAILIFDIWNPYLSEDERDLVRAAIETVGSYYRGTVGRA